MTTKTGMCVLLIVFGVLLVLITLLGLCEAAERQEGATLQALQRSYVNVLVGYSVRVKDKKELNFSAGSGSVLYSDGVRSLVLTCAHVVDFKDATIAVYGEDEHDSLAEPLVATVERIDKDRDLALLLVDGVAGRVLPLASVEPPRWSRVLAMGNGGGVGAWGSDGVVSARVSTIHGHRYWRLTAPMIFGMSGGPVIDDKGRLVCVLSNMLTHSVVMPDGSLIRTPATSFSYCIPLGTIRDFLQGVKL